MLTSELVIRLLIYVLDQSLCDLKIFPAWTFSVLAQVSEDGVSFTTPLKFSTPKGFTFCSLVAKDCWILFHSIEE